MADPICRWRNSSVKQLLEYNDLFPYQEQSSGQARNTIESRWSILGGKDFFTTPYQLAAQMALYYEDNNHFYPRLNRKLSIEEARDYMNTWAKLYYAPNPYSPSMNLTEHPVIINNFLVNWCIDNENASFKDALKSMFREQIGNVDILVNMLNNFSEVFIDGDKLTLKKSAPLQKYEIVELGIDKNDKKSFFDHFSLCYSPCQSIIEHSETKILLFESSIVVEFMGRALQEYLKEDDLNAAIPQMNANASTLGFTGCRFAKLKSWFDSQTDPRRKDDCDTSIIIDFEDNTYYYYKEQSGSTLNVFADKMNGLYTGVFFIEIDDAAGKYRMYRLASAKPKLYFPLQRIFYGAPGTGKSHKVKEVTETLPKSDVFRTTFHPDSDYSTFVGCYKPKMVKAPIRDSSGHEITSACEDEKKRIAYEYEPQAFLKAYVRAYETNEPVFLVIEEINRGNCAQIFGDMFQLLDRNENGESDYAIKPETAIQEFLNEKLKGCDIADETIKSGEEMRLPANLHIWATMNTSDQSLFPIDSAFKRRWDWKYMPINTRKESWSIKVNGTEYSWSSFLEKINEEIGSITNSEDKKLGFYFCKAENGIISAEKFVSKVLFYIYNDVFKDYGFESSKNKDLFKDGDNKLAFGTFYSDNGNIREEKVDLFLKNLGVEDAKRNNIISNDEEDEDGNSSTTESSSRNYDKFSINGSGRYAKNNLAAECVKKYIELNSDITVEEVLHNWSDFKNLVPHFMESKDEFDARTDNSKRSHEIPCNGSVLYVAHNGYGSNGKAQILMDSVNQKGWGLTIERHNA